jgi:hypothetical protein
VSSRAEIPPEQQINKISVPLFGPDFFFSVLIFLFDNQWCSIGAAVALA